MKKSVVYIAVLMALSAGAGVVVGMGIGRKGFSREESRQHALAVLSRSLGLSKEQTEKIEDILDASRAKAEAIKKETLKNLGTIKEGINSEIKAALTPDQQVKFDRLMTERKQREGVGAPPEDAGPHPR